LRKEWNFVQLNLLGETRDSNRDDRRSRTRPEKEYGKQQYQSLH
jgi:hypothetical protein